MNLGRLLLLLDNNENPDCTAAPPGGQGDLFAVSRAAPRLFEEADIEVIAGLHSPSGIKRDSLPPPAMRFYELSVNAFDAFVHAWMSELPLEREMLIHGRRVIAAPDRRAAEAAAADRGDPNTLAVLAASEKVHHEIHRMLGFLRFFPDTKGSGAACTYTARCSPDYFVLPALGGHFTARFGQTAWSIIDERRGLSLRRQSGKPAEICATDEVYASGGDEWEELWRHYHKTINNEGRKNTGLQRRFMPKRYWKYLSEM